MKNLESIASDGEYYETIGRELMKWSHDGKTWVIGVVED